jgi:hypothetical protein
MKLKPRIEKILGRDISQEEVGKVLHEIVDILEGKDKK